jgi:catechol 2,3-dioxygenase-like lactoylglutathione lyase family enzyme
MPRPNLIGIHHLKFAVADLARSLDYYERVFGAQRIEKFDHIDPNGRLFAYIISIPGTDTPLELRLNASAASRQIGFDPVTFLVDSRVDLEKWINHLSVSRVPHSGLLVGALGWLVAMEDPDGRRIRLYTRETHGPEEQVSWDSPWIRDP